MIKIRSSFKNQSGNSLLGCLILIIVGIAVLGFIIESFSPRYTGQAMLKLENGKVYRPLVRLPDEGLTGGVCAGIAYKFGVDPWLPRAGFLIGVFVIGGGFLVYAGLLVFLESARTPPDYFDRISS